MQLAGKGNQPLNDIDEINQNVKSVNLNKEQKADI